MKKMYFWLNFVKFWWWREGDYVAYVIHMTYKSYVTYKSYMAYMAYKATILYRYKKSRDGPGFFMGCGRGISGCRPWWPCCPGDGCRDRWRG